MGKSLPTSSRAIEHIQKTNSNKYDTRLRHYKKRGACHMIAVLAYLYLFAQKGLFDLQKQKILT